MKSIFESQALQELASRLAQLRPDSQPLWGKMTAPQMLKHTRIWEEMIHENKRYPRPFIGRLIGPFILPRVLKNPEFPKNSPTIPEMLITETAIDFNAERDLLAKLLAGYTNYDFPDYSFIHPFFGKMTRAQIGLMAYKHLDHHLQQFGV